MSSVSENVDFTALQSALQGINPTASAAVLRTALPDIISARDRGVSYAEICEVLSKGGIKTTPRALVQLIYRASKKTEPNRVTAASRLTQPLSPAPPKFHYDPSRAHQMLRRTTKES